MIDSEVWRQYSELLFQYIEKECSVAAVALDRCGLVLHCNQAFLTLLHLLVVPRKQPISDFLSPETREGLSWSDRPDYRQEIWHLQSPGGYYRAQCHIYAGSAFILVFVDKPLLTDSSFAKEFDSINRELSMLSRELQKKNAAIETANRKLLENEMVLQQAAEMADVGNWQWNMKTNKMHVSSSLCRLWDNGIDDRSMTQAEFLSHFVGEDAIRIMEWLVASKETGCAGEIEFRYWGAAGVERFGYCRADVLCDIAGRQEMVIGVIQDITERKLYQQKIERIAFYDSLTGLPNRKMFEDFYIKASSQAQRQGGTIAILLMDLDGFKLVNDTLGHNAGDFVLQTIGRRLLDSVRSEDTVARLGGDEFIAYLGQLNSQQEAKAVAERILSACNQPIAIGQQSAVVGICIGISFFSEDGKDLETLMKQADLAMYFSKSKGKNSISLHNEIVDPGEKGDGRQS